MCSKCGNDFDDVKRVWFGDMEASECLCWRCEIGEEDGEGEEQEEKSA